MYVSPPFSLSGHAAYRTRRTADYVLDDRLLTAAEGAAETGGALSTVWRDVKRGVLPPASCVTSCAPRWRRSELRATVEACRAPMGGRA
jgi:predicted DNA-binding transcriptional regulator AlpA